MTTKGAIVTRTEVDEQARVSNGSPIDNIDVQSIAALVSIITMPCTSFQTIMSQLQQNNNNCASSFLPLVAQLGVRTDKRELAMHMHNIPVLDGVLVLGESKCHDDGCGLSRLVSGCWSLFDSKVERKVGDGEGSERKKGGTEVCGERQKRKERKEEREVRHSNERNQIQFGSPLTQSTRS